MGKYDDIDIVSILDFKTRYTKIILIIAIMLSIIFLTEVLCGLLNIKWVHLYDHMIYLLSQFVLFSLLCRSRQWLLFVACYHLISTFVIIILDVYFLVENEMRLLWLYVNTGSAFMLLGNRVGWLAASLSVIFIAWSSMTGVLHLSLPGFASFSIGLLSAGTMLNIYNLEGRRLIASRDAALASLDFMAHHDALTGLPNLAGFQEISTRLADRSSQPYSIVFFDIDHFKSVNDRFGHATGDAVIRQVAAAAAAAVRASDIVARIGGEEFVAMLPDTESTGAAVVSEKLRAAIEAHCITVDGQMLSVTASFGWATSFAPHGHIDAIVRLADEAMYHAKQAGRNCVVAAQTSLPLLEAS